MFMNDTQLGICKNGKKEIVDSGALGIHLEKSKKTEHQILNP